MTPDRRPARSFALALIVLVVLGAAISEPVLAMPNAVRLLIGSWGGSGRLYYTDGTSEGIRCRAYYTGRGHELGLAILCKSEKNPIHIRSKLRVSGNRVYGRWEERTFNARGTAEGTLGARNMRLSISGSGLTGKMIVSIRRSSHRVTILTQAIAMSRATMDFTRR